MSYANTRSRDSSADDWSATIDETDTFLADKREPSTNKGELKSGTPGTSKGHPAPEPQVITIAKALASCALYMIIGPSLILTNKYIFKDLNFPYPMAVSCLGLVTTSIASHVAVRFLKLVKLEHKDLVNREFYTFNIVPVGIALASTLACGNAVYLHLNVAFIQMLKAFTPVIVMCGLIISGTDIPRKEKVLAVIGIAITTFANCAGAIEYTLYGLFLMFAAESFEAIRLVLTQKLLKNLKFSVVEGQYWLAPASMTTLLLFSLLTEWRKVEDWQKLQIVFENPGTFLASAFLGLFVNFSSFLVVKTTSSVTLKVLGTVRNALLILFQVFFANEIITTSQFLAYMLTVVCFSIYTYYDMKKD